MLEKFYLWMRYSDLFIFNKILPNYCRHTFKVNLNFKGENFITQLPIKNMYEWIAHLCLLQKCLLMLKIEMFLWILYSLSLFLQITDALTFLHVSCRYVHRFGIFCEFDWLTWLSLWVLRLAESIITTVFTLANLSNFLKWWLLKLKMNFCSLCISFNEKYRHFLKWTQ